MNKKPGGIMIIGLGPGDPMLVTREVWQLLERIPKLYVRTRYHPVIEALPAGLTIESFDALYDQSVAFQQVYEEIVNTILDLGKTKDGVVYAVPGHPYVAEATSPEIARRAKQEGIPVKIMEGVSFLEPTFTALEIDPYPSLVLVDALELGEKYTPSFPPSLPALIAQIYSRQVAAEVKLTLMEAYPDEHPVRLVHAAGTAAQIIEDLPLYAIDHSDKLGLLSSLYIPPLPADSSMESFQNIIAQLRAPNGCPWDREQTHQSLRPNLLEETYEALTALDEDDPQAMLEEFGDLLLQIVLHAQIANEYGEFRLSDVIQGINRKIVRRHPHVFGEMQIEKMDDLLVNWERLKAEERQENGYTEKGLLDGVPGALPSLAQAQSYQERVKRVGFDWPDIQGVMEKVIEEIDEVKSAPPEKRFSEIGDLLFAVVNLGRWYDVNAESALRETNQRFLRRFRFIERRVRETGQKMGELSLAEMDVFWDEAKRLED
jgi:tetrapyrrole methylase family protein/MazG family protein